MLFKKTILIYSLIGGLLLIGDYYIIDLKIFANAELLVPLLYILPMFLAMFALNRNKLELNFRNLFRINLFTFFGIAVIKLIFILITKANLNENHYLAIITFFIIGLLLSAFLSFLYKMFFKKKEDNSRIHVRIKS